MKIKYHEVTLIEGEIWKEIEDFPSYFISNLGRLKRTGVGRDKIIKGSFDKDGYIKIGLVGKNGIKYTTMHRLVATTFIPNPENKEQVNHLNKVKNDNRVENLEWCTCLENIKHSYKDYNFRSGRNQKGEKNNYSKLTEENVHEIRRMIKEGYTYKQIANKFNIHHLYVPLIKSKRRWGWLEERDV